MILDIHTHIGDFRWSFGDDEALVLNSDMLIERLDSEGIDQAVVLPVYNVSPESKPVGMTFNPGNSVREQIERAASWIERLIPFANLDPRWGKDFTEALDWFQERGCCGVGELMAFLSYDDPRVINMFQQISERNWPIVIESSQELPGKLVYGAGLADDPGMPRLERLLNAAPKAIILGHGAGFWAEMKRTDDIPDGKRAYRLDRGIEGGAVPRLLKTYDTLYGDLSARSAFAALARDIPFAIDFLERFQDKLFFGTDCIGFADEETRNEQTKKVERLIGDMIEKRITNQELFNAVDWHRGVMPQLPFLKALRDEKLISETAFAKITYDNAKRLLNQKEE